MRESSDDEFINESFFWVGSFEPDESVHKSALNDWLWSSWVQLKDSVAAFRSDSTK